MISQRQSLSPTFALGHWAALEDDFAQRRELVTMLRAGGVLTVGGGALKVLELLEQVGVFRNGGVLVGSHAFVAFGNMLGFMWDKASLRTQDVDIPRDEHIRIAAEPAGESDLAGALLDAEMGFFEVPALDWKQPSTSYKVRGRQLHVDVLTPLRGRTRDAPVYLPSLKTAAQPLRFLDYLLEETQPAVLVGNAGVLVQVPHPARFALHKLLTSGQRPVSQHGKARKDLWQAEQVLAALLDERPGDLALAWRALEARGVRWTKRVVEAGGGIGREVWEEALQRMGWQR